MKRQEKYRDTSTFHFYNANPKNKITSDCVIRAICTALERPYDEIYEELFKYSIKCGYMLNDKKCYEKYLESKGWKKHHQPKKPNNTKYSGKEFCEDVQDNSWNLPKRIVAHIGSHHLVAIIDGKVWDVWDSTYGSIGNWWSKE